MANDLRILITGALNSATSLSEINKGIEQLQGKINKLNLSVKIDQNVLKTLNDFSTQMNKIADIAKNTGKVIQESINPDGSRIKTTYYNGLKGEFSQVETAAKKTGETVTKSAEQQQQAINRLTQTYKDLTRESKSYNDQVQLTRNTQTYQNGNNTLKVNTTSTGTNYQETLNPAKDAKQQQQLIAQMEQFRLQSLQRVQQRELQWNTAQQQSIQRNGDLERQEIARTEASRQQYENWWTQSLNNRELQNKNLQQSLLSQADKLLNSGSGKLNYSGLNELVTDLKNLSPASATANRELEQMRSRMSEFTNQVNHAHESTLTFSESLKQALAGFSLWTMTATIIYAPIHALQDMTQRLIEIDTQMTDIKRVMDEPDFKFTQMLQDAVSTSDQLSSKLTDVLSIMDSFGRMGFNDSQLTDITKTAQVLQNISDLNASDSVDSLTSAMLNFNIASQDSINIADKLNEVDNHYAITTQDLADSIRKAAATAKTFGVTLD
jgi:hypothetical protein